MVLLSHQLIGCIMRLVQEIGHFLSLPEGEVGVSQLFRILFSHDTRKHDAEPVAGFEEQVTPKLFHVVLQHHLGENSAFPALDNDEGRKFRMIDSQVFVQEGADLDLRDGEAAWSSDHRFLASCDPLVGQAEARRGAQVDKSLFDEKETSKTISR